MMQTTDAMVHVASIKIDVAADDAYAFIKDARNLGQWALGAMSAVEATAETYVGDSIIDGQRVYVKAEGDQAHKVVYFSVGPAWDRLKQLLLCRLVPGDMLGIGDQSCLLTMTAWRVASLAPERWRQLCASHETEMFLLKNRVEASVAMQADSLSAAR
jgi:hypothetical protein